MDANEITCPKCGHLNNYISEGCVKCGIIFSKYFEVHEKQQEPSPAAVTVDPGKDNEIPVTSPIQTSESATLESTPADDKAQEVSGIPMLEPEGSLPVEAKPEGTQPKPVSKISVDEIEMPIDALTETPEDEQPIPPETPASGKTEQTIEKTVDKTAGPESPADAAPVQSEVQTTDQASVQATETQVTEEAPIEPSPPPVKNETTAPAADVVELVEPVKPQTEAKPETESKTEEAKPQIQPQIAPKNEVEPVKIEVGPSPIEEKDKVEAPEKEAPVEAEAEILLEEVAEPAKADAKPEKLEDSARGELLKKQKAALAKPETEKKQKQAQPKAEAEKKQKLVKLEALKKQKAAQAKAEALRKRRAELARAAALKKQKAAARTEALKQQKTAQAAIETQTKETQASVKAPSQIRKPVMAKSIESSLKIMALLKKYEGKTVGINYDNSAEIKEAELVEANDEFFSVAVKDKKLQYSYPLQTLLSLVEGEDGVETEESENKAKYSAVIKVYPLVLF